MEVEIQHSLGKAVLEVVCVLIINHSRGVDKISEPRKMELSRLSNSLLIASFVLSFVT